MKVFKIHFLTTSPTSELCLDYIVAARTREEALIVLGQEDPIDYLHNVLESNIEEMIIEEIQHLDYNGVYPSVLFHFFEWIK